MLKNCAQFLLPRFHRAHKNFLSVILDLMIRFQTNFVFQKSTSEPKSDHNIKGKFLLIVKLISNYPYAFLTGQPLSSPNAIPAMPDACRQGLLKSGWEGAQADHQTQA